MVRSNRIFVPSLIEELHPNWQRFCVAVLAGLGLLSLGVSLRYYGFLGQYFSPPVVISLSEGFCFGMLAVGLWGLLNDKKKLAATAGAIMAIIATHDFLAYHFAPVPWYDAGVRFFGLNPENLAGEIRMRPDAAFLFGMAGYSMINRLRGRSVMAVEDLSVAFALAAGALGMLLYEWAIDSIAWNGATNYAPLLISTTGFLLVSVVYAALGMHAMRYYRKHRLLFVYTSVWWLLAGAGLFTITACGYYVQLGKNQAHIKNANEQLEQTQRRIHTNFAFFLRSDSPLHKAARSMTLSEGRNAFEVSHPSFELSLHESDASILSALHPIPPADFVSTVVDGVIISVSRLKFADQSVFLQSRYNLNHISGIDTAVDPIHSGSLAFRVFSNKPPLTDEGAASIAIPGDPAHILSYVYAGEQLSREPFNGWIIYPMLLGIFLTSTIMLQIDTSLNLGRLQDYQSAADRATSAALIVANESGWIISANPVAEELFGIPESALLTMRVADLPILTIEHIAHSDGVDEFSHLKTAVRRANGERTPISFSSHKLTLPSGHMGTHITALDISAEEAFLLEIETKQELLLELLDSATDGIAAIAEDGRLALISESGARMLGYTKQELYAKKSLADLLSNLDVDSAQFTELFTTYSGEFSTELVCKSGGLLPIRGTISHTERSTYRSIVIFRDATEHLNHEERRERELAQIRELYDELKKINFAFSHDLSEPLRGASVFLSMACGAVERGDVVDASGHLSSLEDALHRLIVMFDAFREYTDIQVRDAAAARVSVKRSIDSCVELVADELAHIGAKTQIDVPDTLSVFAHRLHFHRILLELLSNTIRYRNPDVPLQVRISAYVSDEQVRIKIEDNGPGIPSDARKSIFDPFRTLEGYSRAKGVGMGLTVAKKLAAVMRGDVYVADSTLGGAAFVLQLPNSSELTQAHPLEHRRDTA